MAYLLQDTRFTVEYLVRFVSRLQPLTQQQQKMLLLRIAAALTQQGVPVEGTLKPAGESLWPGSPGRQRCYLFRLTGWAMHTLVMGRDVWKSVRTDQQSRIRAL